MGGIYRRDQHKTLKLLQAPEDQRIVAKDNLRPEMKESVTAVRRCRRAEQRCREVWRMQKGEGLRGGAVVSLLVKFGGRGRGRNSRFDTVFFFFLFFHRLDMSKTQIKETSCRESPALRKDPLASGEIGTVKPDSGQGVMTVLW